MNKITLDEIESGLVGDKNEERVARQGPMDLFLAKGDGLDLGVTIEVERNGYIVYILNAEPLELVIAWLGSIRKNPSKCIED